MGGTPGEWDERARPEKWLERGEQILWRGTPDASVIFSPQDLYLVPFSLLWTGFAIFWEHNVAKEGWSFGVVWGIPFILVGIYIVIGRFPVKVWTRLHTAYAITDLRAVEITKRGDRIRDAGRAAPVQIRSSRDGRHGTMIFNLDPDGRPMRWLATTQQPFLRGTGWPGAGRLPEVAFVDVDGFDELVSKIRGTGFVLDDQATTSVQWSMGIPTQLPDRSERRGRFGLVRGWVRSRLLREPYSLSSPLPPSEVARQLSQHLAPLRLFSLGFSDVAPYQGTVDGWNVRLMKVGSMQGNSWRLVFDGNIVQDGTGSKLTGTLGPIGFVPVFSAIWFSFVSLFFLIGAISLISDLLSSHGASVAPLVLVPMAMLIAFVGITEFGARTARREWGVMDRWLRVLLQVPPDAPPPAS